MFLLECEDREKLMSQLKSSQAGVGSCSLLVFYSGLQLMDEAYPHYGEQSDLLSLLI